MPKAPATPAQLLSRKAKVTRRLFEGTKITHRPIEVHPDDGRLLLGRNETPGLVLVPPLGEGPEMAISDERVGDACFVGPNRIAYLFRLAGQPWNGAYEVHEYDLATGNDRRVYTMDQSVQDEEIHADRAGEKVVFNTGTNLQLWDAKSWTMLCSFETSHLYGGRVTLSADGSLMANTAWAEGEVVLRDGGGRKLESFTTPGLDHAGSMAICADGQHLAVIGATDKQHDFLVLWRRGEKQPIICTEPLGPHGTPTVVAFSPDGLWLAVGDTGKTVQIFEVATGQLVWKKQCQKSMIGRLAFTPDSRTLFVGSSFTSAPVVVVSLFG